MINGTYLMIGVIGFLIGFWTAEFAAILLLIAAHKKEVEE